MNGRDRLLALLADGEPHTNESLSHCTGLTAPAVARAIASLEALGLAVEALPGRGVRLERALNLLNRTAILAQIDEPELALLGGLTIVSEIDSTNRYLLDRSQQFPQGYACLAEHQSAGRGRRGRAWASPFGANVYLSVLWRMSDDSRAPQGLSLAMGAAAAEAIATFGISDVGLKWPNDLLWRRRKLGGVLVEAKGVSRGIEELVVGIGLNVAMAAPAAARVDQPWTDLVTAAGGPMDRSQVAGRVLRHVLRSLDEFAREGFAAFHSRWSALDVARGREVVLQRDSEALHGRADGVDETGALLLRVAGGVETVVSGDVSLKLSGPSGSIV